MKTKSYTDTDVNDIHPVKSERDSAPAAGGAASGRAAGLVREPAVRPKPGFTFIWAAAFNQSCALSHLSIVRDWMASERPALAALAADGFSLPVRWKTALVFPNSQLETKCRASGRRGRDWERASERAREPFLNCAQRSRDLIALLRRIFVPLSRSIRHCRERERLEILNLIGLLFVPIGGDLCQAGLPIMASFLFLAGLNFLHTSATKTASICPPHNSHVTSETACTQTTDANAFLSLWSNFRPSV